MGVYYRLNVGLTLQEQERCLPLLRLHRKQLSLRFYELAAEQGHDPGQLPAAPKDFPAQIARINLLMLPSGEALQAFLRLHGRKQCVRASVRTCFLQSLHDMEQMLPHNGWKSPLNGKPVPPPAFFADERSLLAHIGTDFGAACTEAGINLSRMKYDWFALPMEQYGMVHTKASWKKFMELALQVCPDWCNT